MKDKIFLFVCLFVSSNLSCEKDYDYFHIYKEDVIFRVYTSTDMFQIKQYNLQDKTLIFKPNQSLTLGAGFAYKWIVLSLGTTVADLTDNQVYGKSSNSKIALGLTIGKHYANVDFQQYKGFFFDNYLDLGLKTAKNGMIPNLPNLKLTNLNCDYRYFTNGNRFSFSPYFSGNSVMTQTSGSLILGASVDYYELKNDSSFANKLAQIQSDQQIKSVSSIAPYLTLGYGQHFYLGEHLSMMLIANVGGGMEKQHFINRSDANFDQTRLTYRIDGFAGLMYTHPRYFLSLTTKLEWSEHNLNRTSFETLGNGLMLNLGYRIKTKNSD